DRVRRITDPHRVQRAVRAGSAERRGRGPGEPRAVRRALAGCGPADRRQELRRGHHADAHLMAARCLWLVGPLLLAGCPTNALPTPQLFFAAPYFMVQYTSVVTHCSQSYLVDANRQGWQQLQCGSATVG